jgi:hypothetical protein
MYSKVHILREEECFKENKIFILKIIMFNVTQYKSKVFSTLLWLFPSLPTRFASVAATAQILYWFRWLRHGGGLTGPQNRLYLR